MIKSFIYSNNADQNTKQHDKIYKTHKYWSRKPWKPIQDHILAHTNKHDIVLDMFMGSGVTALESILNTRQYAGIDLNPMAIFITENTIYSDFISKEFDKEFSELSQILESKILSLYTTNEVCQNCHCNLVLQHTNIGPKFSDKEEGYFICPKCRKRNSSLKRELTKEEKNKFLNTNYKITYWVPNKEFPTKFYKDRFSYKGIKKVSDMYTNKNLYALSLILHEIKNSSFKYKNLFLLAFSNTVLHASKLKSENVRPLGVNNYWVPDDYMEENVWLRFINRVGLIKASKIALLKELNSKELENYTLLNQSCFTTGLSDSSIDYIITDPPYGDAIQYSELSFIWNAWLGFDYDIDEEVIINPVQSKKHNEFIELLTNSIKEASRVLKDKKYFTLCFHNKDFKIWGDVLNIFKKNNFCLEEIYIVDTLGSTFNNNWAKFSPKTDLYLTFQKRPYKPLHNEEVSLENIIRDTLQADTEKNYTKIYDHVLIKLIESLFYNEFQIDLSKLNIQKLAKIIEKEFNGD